MATDENTQPYQVGQELPSYCNACEEPTTHAILTLFKKGTPNKCECKTCGDKHRYQDPDKPNKSPVGKKATPKISAGEAWKKAIAGATGAGIPYSMTGEFSEGNLIDHPTFGLGVVEEIVDQNKIKVTFEEGAKILIHKRT